jgi:N-acetylmuramoyl-L-alanine amidase
MAAGQKRLPQRLARLGVLTMALTAAAGATRGGGPVDSQPRAKTHTADAFVVSESKANKGRSVSRGLAPTSTAVSALRGKTVVIDPGHNGANFQHGGEINRLVDAGTLRKPCDTTGTQTASGYTEAAYTLDLSRRLAKLLRRAGARVVLTRTTNDGWGPCITDRAAIGNRAHADAAISIHADGGPASGRGCHVIYPPPIPGLTDDIAAASYRLALDVRTAFATGTGELFATYFGDRGLDARSDLGGLNLSDVPKVFIETANMRNAADASWLRKESFPEKQARALAAALQRFLGRT